MRCDDELTMRHSSQSFRQLLLQLEIVHMILHMIIHMILTELLGDDGELLFLQLSSPGADLISGVIVLRLAI